MSGGVATGSKRTAVWIAIAVVVVAAAVGAYALTRGRTPAAPRTGTDLSDAATAMLYLQTPASAWWSGNGDFAVLQCVGRDDRPQVVIWERSSGTTRTLAHYRVVDVEPHAPRVWLVPDDRITGQGLASADTTPPLLDIAGDGWDSQPAELYALRLDGKAAPTSAVDARWTAWDGPGGMSVSVEIDVNKGSCASTLRFTRTGSSLNAWSAKVPADVQTFEPIGWSASGEYFAVVTQSSAASATALAGSIASGFGDTSAEAALDASAGVADEGASGDALTAETTVTTPVLGADILVFRTADGALAARRRIGQALFTPASGSGLAAWVGERLYFADVAGGGDAVVRAMGPGGSDLAVEDAAAPWAGRVPGALQLAARNGHAVVFALGESADVYELEGPPVDRSSNAISVAPTATHVGSLRGGLVARMSPKGEALSLAEFVGADRWTLYRSAADGSASRQLIAVPDPAAN